MGCVRNCWTDKDVDLLRAWYVSREGKALDLGALAAALERSKPNVARKARSLGLTDARRVMVDRDDAGLRPCDRKRAPKFTDDGERRAHVSQIRQASLAKNGHPRGMLGKKHTEETKRRVGKASRELQAALTPEEKDARRAKATATKLERYGTANPSMHMQDQPYSRTKGGKRDDLGGMYFRSSWEANYCRYLIWLQEQGEILAWEYEPETFRFEGVSRGPYTYLPDFKVTERDGSVAFHEVKGWMDGPSKSRLKRMAKYYPDVNVIVIGEEEYKALSKWRELIPGWEGTKRL
jgi:hypothetical protein